MIPLCVPQFGGNEWVYVKECLDTSWVSSVGGYVDRFEKSVGDFVGSKHSIATVNGTSALHISMLVAGVLPSDEVLVPALTFIAPVNAIRYCQAYPMFMDVDPQYWQMDANKLHLFLNQECTWKNGSLTNKQTGRRISAILPVHILGHPVDMYPVLELARQFALPVIEDATESLGAFYRGRATGNLADIACFSFNGNKVITTGGGGMIVTNNSEWAAKAKYLTTQAKDDALEFIHNEIGYNYRLTNVQAAIGVAQMEQLPSFLSRKKEIAACYRENLAPIDGLQPFVEADWADSTYWMNAVRVDKDTYGKSRRDLMVDFQKQGIEVRPLWHPIHSLPPYRDCQTFQVEVVDRLYEQVLCLPSSVGLTREEQETVIAALRKS